MSDHVLAYRSLESLRASRKRPEDEAESSSDMKTKVGLGENRDGKMRVEQTDSAVERRVRVGNGRGPGVGGDGGRKHECLPVKGKGSHE